MNEVEIIKRLTPIVRETFKDDTLLFDNDLDASKIQAWNSLSFTALLTTIESDFGFKFKMMEIIQIHNLGDIVKLIKNHIER